MYGRAQYILELEAVDAADSCISAAVDGADYSGRLVPFTATLSDVALHFWPVDKATGELAERPGIEFRATLGLFTLLANGERLTGIESLEASRRINWVREKLKGKLFATRLRAQEQEGKPKCLKPKEHMQPCFCKNVAKFNLSQSTEGGI